MQGSSILKPLFQSIIATKIVDKVFHSVIIREENKKVGPIAKVEGRFKYLGVDDTKGFFCYCRQIGPLEVVKTEAIGGCQSKLYRTQIPHRLVFYNDREDRSQELLISQLMKAVVGATDIRLQKVYSDPKAILLQESPALQLTYKVNTFYCAIDFFVLLKIQADTCEAEISCENNQNPYCGVTE